MKEYLSILVLALCLALGIAVVVIGISKVPPVDPPDTNVQAFPVKSKILSYKFTEPEVGMRFSDYYALCLADGKMAEFDKTSTYEGHSHIVISRLQYTENRGKTRCWGTFTFIDYELTSIFRGTQ